MIPSLLQIPSAVSDSKLHSVLPNNGKGDFTFDRSTGATRINKDGLIEEVGYFSGELVQNGNFSELGSELITNGDFATDSNWGKGTGWSIINGVASCDGTQTGGTQLVQTSLTFTNGKTYKVVFTCTIEAGNLDARLQGGGTVTGDTVTTSGTYTQYLVSTGNTSFRMRGNADFIGTVDNVSVKQVDPNDRWTTSLAKNVSGWSIENDIAICDGTQTTNSGFIQASVFESGKNYMLNFDLTSNGQGIKFWVNGSQNIFSSALASGSYKYEFTTTVSGSAYFEATANFVGTLDNVSVVEVQGDRPRLSYDITNGVVDSQPHLLLEPSSTNLYVNSEPTANEGAAGSVSYVDFNWSLGFTNAIEFTSGDFRYGGSVSASTVNTLSFFILMDDLSQPVVGANSGEGDFSVVIGGSVMTSGFEVKNFGNNVYRVCVTGTSGTNTSNNGIVKYNSQSSKAFKVVGWQLEQQAFATSYIKTAGTAITRSAETCNNSKPSVNSTEGVLYAEMASLTTLNDDERTISLSDGTNINTVRLQFNTLTNNIRVFVGNGSTQANMNTTISDITDFNKLAFKYKANDFALWINGVEVLTDTIGTTFSSGTLNKLGFVRGDNAEYFYGKIKGLAVYNEALSESQLMQLTGVTASSIYNNFVTRTASFTVEALNEVKKVIDNL